MKGFGRRLGAFFYFVPILILFQVGCGGGNSSSSSSAPVVLPTIQSISPSTISADSSGPVEIVITGTGFIATSQVQVNKIAVATTYVSAVELNAVIPVSMIVSGAKLTIVVVNGSVSSESNTSSNVTVTNPAPTIVSIAPSSALVGDGPMNVTITGTGFVPTTSVSLNGAPRTTAYVTNTQITATTTADDLGSAGTLNLVAINPAPGGGTSAAATFTVNNLMPVIGSISPASVTEGSAGFTLDVKGRGFPAGSIIYWNTTALASTVVSSTEMTAAVPATLLTAGSSIKIVVVAPAPGGGQSAAATFDVLSPKPTLSSILPGTVEVNQSASITLSGSGYAPDSVVQWNGSSRPATLVSSSTLIVSLSAADLATVGTGNISVTNPAPGGGTSAALALNITNQPIPAITGASLSVVPAGDGCQQIQLHVTGTNFFSTQLSVNGEPVQGYGNATDWFANLPNGFSSTGAFVVIATNNLGSPVSSDPYTLPASTPPVLALCTLPTDANIYTGSNFLVTFLASQVNTGGSASINKITLPSGISTTTPIPFNVAQGGTRVVFTAASTLTAGTLSMPFSGSIGTATSSGTIPLIATTSPPPSFYFPSPLFTELGVPIGGSASIPFSSIANSGVTPVDYTVNLSVSGLPSGTTATIRPSTIIPGDNFTVTVNAAANAPESQNVPITITGTPSAATAQATTKFTLDVTPKPGSLAGNRTDFVSTGGTPDGMVYDRQLDLIFVSNPSWNRIDVISNKTHTLQRSIPIRGPQGIDISQDGSTVWIGTLSQQIFALNTTTFALTRYLLPAIPGQLGGSWQDSQLLALSDGSLFLYTLNAYQNANNVIWTPATNQFTVIPWNPWPYFFNLRSGDGTKAYGNYYASGYTNMVYDTSTKTVTAVPPLGGGAYIVAANHDGSLLVGSDNGLYTSTGQLIGELPAYLGDSYYQTYGSTVFSPDGSTVYQIGSGANGSFIATINIPSLSLAGIAPALATLPNGVSGNPMTTTNIAVDNTGMLVGIQTYGVGLEDSTFFQNFGASPRTPGSPVLLSPNAGPLTGGTASVPYGSYDLTPDVWYGQNKGTASVDATNMLTITSPPGNADGPVNLKYIYPSGVQVFTPQAFSYSVYPQYSILSGSSPDGGVPGRISGYGMPADASGGTLTVGGQTATITTTVGQYPPYTGEAFPSTYLDYTMPAGNPGFADLSITTPIGSGTLPKAVFYAKSVNDYSSTDTFTDVLYDAKRQQVYLSGSDHIDVFSLTSRQWLTPLKPAAVGSQSQFRGMAMTPDGSELLAANFLDNSLGVINPDNPAQTFAIQSPGTQSGSGTCATGPFSVAALAGNQAFVGSGLPTGIGGCPYNEVLYFVNLQTHTMAPATQCGGNGSINESSADGTLAVVGAEEGGFCFYSTANGSFLVGQSSATDYYGVAMAGDGNIISGGNAFMDTAGNIVGNVAHPAVLYPGMTSTPYPLNNYPPQALQRPRLNAAGSLYYWAYPNYFDIIDVPTARLRLRFSLKETIQSVETPIAIDQGGRMVFLITNSGLTIVDLGSAPLSIGHLSSSSGAAGTQIQVRGSGFAAGATATVGGQPCTITVTDENTLSLTVPPLPTGPQDLTITNPDGTSYTLGSAITVP